MSATSISDIILENIRIARTHLSSMDAIPDSESQAKICIELAFQTCDDIKDVTLQQESIKQLNELIKESINAGVDISFYLTYYIKWIKQVAQTDQLKDYIGYATEVYIELSKDIRKKEKDYGLIAETLDTAFSDFSTKLMQFTTLLNDREKNKRIEINKERREKDKFFDTLLEDVTVTVFTIADIIKDVHKALHDKDLEQAKEYLNDAQEKLISADAVTKSQYTQIIHDLFLQLGIATKCDPIEQNIHAAKEAIKENNIPKAKKHIAEAAGHLEAIKHSISLNINEKYKKELEDLSLQLQDPALIANKALEAANKAIEENNLLLAQKKIEMASAILEQLSPGIISSYTPVIEDMNLYIKTLGAIEEAKDFLSNHNDCSRVRLNKTISNLKEIETACEQMQNKSHKEDCMFKLEQLHLNLEEKRRKIIESYIEKAKAAIRTAREAKAENKNLSEEILKLRTLLSELDDIHIIRLNLTSYDEKQQLMGRLLTLSETLTDSKKQLESQQPPQQVSDENSFSRFFSRLSSSDTRRSRTDSSIGNGRDSLTDKGYKKSN